MRDVQFEIGYRVRMTAWRDIVTKEIMSRTGDMLMNEAWLRLVDGIKYQIWDQVSDQAREHKLIENKP